MSVLNISYYDSDNDNDDCGGGVNEYFDTEREKSPDETTEELQEILEEKLKEVSTVTIVGYKSFRLDFFETDFKFEDKNCDCDFDIDSNKMPIIPNGGQEYIIPYLYELMSFYDNIKNTKYQTNLNVKFIIK